MLFCHDIPKFPKKKGNGVIISNLGNNLGLLCSWSSSDNDSNRNCCRYAEKTALFWEKNGERRECAGLVRRQEVRPQMLFFLNSIWILQDQHESAREEPRRSIQRAYRRIGHAESGQICGRCNESRTGGIDYFKGKKFKHYLFKLIYFHICLKVNKIVDKLYMTLF